MLKRVVRCPGSHPEGPPTAAGGEYFGHACIYSTVSSHSVLIPYKSIAFVRQIGLECHARNKEQARAGAPATKLHGYHQYLNKNDNTSARRQTLRNIQNIEIHWFDPLLLVPQFPPAFHMQPAEACLRYLIYVTTLSGACYGITVHNVSAL